jgi:uncharacterized protein (DUF305 family)
MLTDAELRRLAAARGAEFDRLFLDGHDPAPRGGARHGAALPRHAGAAQEPETFGFASDVDADQRAEIARMRALLRPSSPTPRPRSNRP